jgi:hypothetical protein
MPWFIEQRGERSSGALTPRAPADVERRSRERHGRLLSVRCGELRHARTSRVRPASELNMQVPLQIRFHNMAASEAIETRVRERVARLERFSDGIISCRVTIEAPHKQPHRSTVGITIDIGVRGREIVEGKGHETACVLHPRFRLVRLAKVRDETASLEPPHLPIFPTSRSSPAMTRDIPIRFAPEDAAIRANDQLHRLSWWTGC